jgi:DNA-directed RNA polymerase subunit RPC12/RpoP
MIVIALVVIVIGQCVQMYHIRVMRNQIHARFAYLDAILKPASRCPECGHPVISAPFCDETEYVCPDCGGRYVWALRDGVYRLEAVGMQRGEP